MKKIILLYGLIILGLASCRKEDRPEKTTDERLSEALTTYRTQLAGAENGWIGYLFPGGGGGYTFKFKFDDKNRVIMYSDMDEEKAATAQESSYRLRATQLPSLYFDTYNYLHLLSDPDPDVAGGSEGFGYLSDFEFSFLSASTDTIKLKGNLNNSSLILIRAKADEGDDYMERAYANNQVIAQVANFQYYYNKISTGGKDYNITINSDQHTVSFYYDEGGFKRFTTEYAIAATGIVLRNPFINGATTISEFHDFEVNVAASTADLYSGTTKLTLMNEATPLTFDRTAPTKMYTTDYDFTSNNGFTMSGITDAQRVNTLPNFVGMQFVANAYSNPLDAVFFYFNGGAARVGPVFNTRLDADGKMVFVRSNFGLQGTNPGAAGIVVVNNFFTQFSNTGGYYAFETGTNCYDLVSVTDSKNWIRFY